MPVSVVVGGQYGSEGKGKVALELIRQDPSITIVVRPGGTNSGHTGYTREGRRIVLRQLPAAAIDRVAKVVLPAGSYIDIQQLLREIAELRLAPHQIAIDPRAQIIRPEHVEWERQAGLTNSIGSTGSGTGGAVISRLARYSPQLPKALPAAEVEALQPYVADTRTILQTALQNGERVLIEGTQGFGLSPIHGDDWPKATSRDTTAAGLLSEVGLSPLHVDRVILVIRCHPIRVAGDSGPLPNETSWAAIAKEAGIEGDLSEFTSVTKRLRRVGNFDADVVSKAIAANAPTEIVLNHVDYIDVTVKGSGELSGRAEEFVRGVERRIGRQIEWVGTDEKSIFPRLSWSDRDAAFGSGFARSAARGLAD